MLVIKNKISNINNNKFNIRSVKNDYNSQKKNTNNNNLYYNWNFCFYFSNSE